MDGIKVSGSKKRGIENLQPIGLLPRKILKQKNLQESMVEIQSKDILIQEIAKMSKGLIMYMLHGRNHVIGIKAESRQVELFDINQFGSIIVKQNNRKSAIEIIINQHIARLKSIHRFFIIIYEHLEPFRKQPCLVKS